MEETVEKSGDLYRIRAASVNGDSEALGLLQLKLRNVRQLNSCESSYVRS
jgi:hypothetical protein